MGLKGALHHHAAAMDTTSNVSRRGQLQYRSSSEQHAPDPGRRSLSPPDGCSVLFESEHRLVDATTVATTTQTIDRPTASGPQGLAQLLWVGFSHGFVFFQGLSAARLASRSIS